MQKRALCIAQNLMQSAMLNPYLYRIAADTYQNGIIYYYDFTGNAKKQRILGGFNQKDVPKSRRNTEFFKIYIFSDLRFSILIKI